MEGFFLKAGPLVKLDADFISDLTNNANDGRLVYIFAGSSMLNVEN